MDTVLPNEYDTALEAIRPVWADLLSVDAASVSEETDFFDAGGHSLSAMLLITRIKRDLGKAPPLFALVENPTLSGFAKYLAEMGDDVAVEEEQAPDGSSSQTERLLGYNDDARREKRHKWFEQYYATAMDSPAHAEFCRAVYGENFGQHGMADFAQIDLMLEKLAPKAGDVILDIGCGYGLIAQYMAQKTGARVVGIDLSPSAISFAQTLADADERLSFHVMDVRDLDFPEGTFTHIVSIDTIYYFPSPKGALETFKRIGRDDLRLGILRTFPIRTFTKETWSPDRTELAALMSDTFGSYQTVDLSPEENAHWAQKVTVLEGLKDRFAAEGNTELYDFRYGEAKYEAGIEQFRYMFVTGTQ